MKKTIVLLAGYPATGKSYLCNKILEKLPDFLIVSQDDEFWNDTEVGTDRFMVLQSNGGTNVSKDLSNATLELESAIQQYQRAEVKLGGCKRFRR